MNNLQQKNSMANAIKVYVFPSLVTIISMLIWRDISELRADVKALLAQSNIDKTRIDNLVNDVKAIETVLYNRKTATNATFFIPPHDPWYKPEEEYDIKKYIKYPKA
jgi:hypothetical protein